MNYLTVDFGSTYTKLTAISSSQAEILGTALSFTTIETDIMEGFENALQELEAKVGKLHYDKILACSSSGGGLKMIALGLVPGLTAKAARMAASSAGAKVVKTYAYEISKAEQEEIYELNPDLVLLSGGTDGGNKDVIVANARRLCEIERDFSIIAAGNKTASYELEEIFKEHNRDYEITENVMPTFNTLNTEPAKASIRKLFIEKIIEAKGLSRVQKMASNEVVPTPLAVLTACELLSKGTKQNKGIGEFMAIDLGGATTDIYSMAKGEPTMTNVVVKGLPENFSKRTVEGDLGMRYSMMHIIEDYELEELATEIGVEKERLQNWIDKCLKSPDTIAGCEVEEKIEERFAQIAVRKAVERHCGYIELTYSPMGEIYTLEGKDLTSVPYVIGIGGAIINSENPQTILSAALYDMQRYNYMKPKSPQFMLDKRYIFASIGLLSMEDPDLALKLMRKEITKIN